MALFKCKMCGGNLEITDGSTVSVCEYCGTKQTVPAADNEKKMNLYARANRLRISCEFDKASGVYESIIADFPEEAEAYWGLVLCKYGIEYVDDPKTAKKIPTCHRSSFESIMYDANFELVMENCDSLSRSVYREEAKQIEELRRGIIEVSNKEEPYDIFICYKETAENGDRTLDSVIAQDVYKELTNEGYRVFFSRITLEDKLGQEYEPYIFAALNSAKVMLAFGTCYEHYNAVWAKNEWSRFLQLIESGNKKVLIPCYKGIDAYDMPKEFAKLQAQDMGKVGAIQDLVRGIDKIIKKDSGESLGVPNFMADQNSNKFENYTKGSIESSIRKSKEKQENRQKEKTQNHNLKPVKSKALLIISIVLFLIPVLWNLLWPMPFIESNPHLNMNKEIVWIGVAFLDIMLLVSATLWHGSRIFVAVFSVVYVVVHFIEQRVYEVGYHVIRNVGFGYLASGRFGSESDYLIYSQIFILILILLNTLPIKKMYCEWSKWVGIVAMAAQLAIASWCFVVLYGLPWTFSSICFLIENVAFILLFLNILPWFKSREKSAYAMYLEGNQLFMSNKIEYITRAKKVFEQIEGYANSSKYIKKCSKKLEIIEAKQRNRRKEAERITKRNKKIAIITTPIVCAIIAFIIVLNTVIIPNGKYNDAIALMDAGKLDEAYSAFIELGDYKDAADMAGDIRLTKNKEQLKSAKVGDYVFFGAYEQDNNTSNGKEDVEWLVLEVKDGKALVISKYALDCKPYNTSYTDVTWETCTLRKWLNNDFLGSAFSDNEMTMIPAVTVSADKNPTHSTNPGNATQDQVFLLSITEVNKYFSSDSVRQCKPTDYAVAGGAYVNSSNVNCWWWLRSPGRNQNHAASVDDDGDVYGHGSEVYAYGRGFYYAYSAVRPALWIDLNS